jgi:hypothetical protein
MEEEIWKDVIGYEGVYQVSSIGRAKTLNYNRSRKERILKLSIRDGYTFITLFKKGKRKIKTIHSLEAEAFIDKDYKLKGLVVNHKNFKRDDNRVENLEVVTIRENNNAKHLPSSSKYTGVSWNKRYKKWNSRIFIDGKSKYLGVFNDEKEASEYYEAALLCVKDGKFAEIVVKNHDFYSKQKGVSFDKNRKKWISYFFYNGKTTQIGSFKTEQQAYEALLDYKIKNGIEI